MTCDDDFNSLSTIEKYDHVKHAVPPTAISDVLILTPDFLQDSSNMFFERFYRLELWFIYISITIVTILFLLSCLSGINSDWYHQINHSSVNPYIIGFLWVIATIISYIAIFMLWENTSPTHTPLDFRLSVLFLVGSFLSLLWSTVLFQANNIALATWISMLLFVFQFFLFTYIWFFKPVASFFMLPVIIMYGFLVYSMVHLLTINNIVI